MSSSLFVASTLLMSAWNVRSAEPNPPNWPDSVYIFNSSMATSDVQQAVDKVFSVNGGTSPPCNGQWSENRYALLFQPGSYDIVVNVGYYTTVAGLGVTPAQTVIRDVVSPDGDADNTVGALNNFWRSAENFLTTPTYTQNLHPNAMMWAVSQGASLRRVVVNGTLDLFQGSGYASGGYMSDVVVTQDINSGSQQQWYARNVALQSWSGKVWNMCFQGVVNAPGYSCGNNQSSVFATNSTPVIAEKPFISFDATQNKYFLNVPGTELNKAGPSNFDNPTAKVEQFDFSQVYVADASKDNATSINAKLSQGLHLVLSPGNYNLSESIQVSKPDTVVLGLGYPVLMPLNGQPALAVSDGLTGVRIAGVLLQAGPKNSSSLLQFGTDPAQSSEPGGYSYLYDIWARVGGPNDPKVEQYMTDIMVQINQNNVVLDNCWLWRADHDITGLVVNSQNPVKNALQINGDDVITYSMKAEHTLGDIVQWNGHNGSAYFFQSEFPYDVTQQNYGDAGFSAFRVGQNVTSFRGYAMGMYSFFRDNAVTVNSAIRTPQVPDVQFENVLTVFLSGKGGITHVVNDQGIAADEAFRDVPAAVCKYGGDVQLR